MSDGEDEDESPWRVRARIKRLTIEDLNLEGRIFFPLRISAMNANWGPESRQLDRVLRGRTVIYSLVDPRSKKSRYVGQTKHPHLRRIEHCADSSVNRSKKDRWLRELLSLSLRPGLRILECVAPNVDAKVREQYWTERLLNEGEPLIVSRSFYRVSITLDRELRIALENIEKQFSQLNVSNRRAAALRLAILETSSRLQTNDDEEDR